MEGLREKKQGGNGRIERKRKRNKEEMEGLREEKKKQEALIKN